jgi:hypothetical protein
MRLKIFLVILAFIPVLLSGCMYPKENLAQNQIPYQDQLQSVQTAVDRFKKDSGGLLPIITKAADTPIYQKYPIDFKKLIPKYLSEVPGNAYENGGVYEYVLVDAETKPTVKLLDLRIAQSIQEIKLRIKAGGYPPYKKRLADNVYTLDFTKLGYKEIPYADSPYTNQKLPFVIAGDAEVYVDYRSDLEKVLQKGVNSVKSGEDIRPLLVNEFMFVPAYSLPYTVDTKTNKPVFLDLHNQ